MKKKITILIAEDDEGHAILIKKNLKRAGINNKVIHFFNGQQLLDFLMKKNQEFCIKDGFPYVLILDVRMPKVDGIAVLEKLKQHEKLRKMPVVIISTTDDPDSIENCHELGCNNYIVKPIEYDEFAGAIKQLGKFIKVMQVPEIDQREKYEKY